MKKELVITLFETPKIGKKSVEYILSNSNSEINDIEELFYTIKNLKQVYKRLPLPDLETLESSFKKALEIIRKSEENGIHIITRDDKLFPDKLKYIPDSPVLLYAKGNLELLNVENSIAVIGTREPSDFGSKLGEKITQYFVENNLVIVSGLAIGCDTIGHETCLNLGGKTIAVLANGLDSVYPKSNSDLAQRIIDNQGLLISEYKIGEKPRNNYFVERDRLQSGLSKGICVVETGVKGGTLHTVRFAGDQKRLISCINHPDKYHSLPQVQGNQMLIGNGKAVPLGTKDEILAFIKDIQEYQFNNNKEGDNQLSLL